MLQCNIHGLAVDLFRDVIIKPDVGDCMYNVGLFNSTICDNDEIVGKILRLVKDLIETLHMLVDILRRRREGSVKGYSTREMIDYS